MGGSNKIIELKKSNTQLVLLVYEFRQNLNLLNRSKEQTTLISAKMETKEYFGNMKKVFGMYIKEELIGFSVIKKEDDVFWLEWIYVKPQHRGFINASSLFDFSENYAIGHGSDQLYIWIHPDNNQMIKFLKKKGYNVLNLLEIKKNKSTKKYKVQILNNEYEY